MVVVVRNKPFWISDKIRHKQEDIKTKGDCCFNHIIGLPTKDKMEKPMFNYEKLLYDSLLIPYISNLLQHTFKHKHLWVKKATGLGVTEFFLRFMAWLGLRNDDYGNSQFCVVSGPNQDIAIKLIKRMKGLFERHDIMFDSKETVLELNGCRIEAFPSNHLDAYRALDKPNDPVYDNMCSRRSWIYSLYKRHCLLDLVSRILQHTTIAADKITILQLVF
jgi:hypothetical protein